MNHDNDDDREKMKDDIFKPQNTQELSANNLTLPDDKIQPENKSTQTEVMKPETEISVPKPPEAKPSDDKVITTEIEDEPQISVELDPKKEENKDEGAGIEVSDSPPSKEPIDANYVEPAPEPEAITEEEDEEKPLPSYRAPLPPIKQKESVKSVMIIAVVAVVLILTGFSSGFFGYKYAPNLFKGQIISADINAGNGSSISQTVPKINSTEPGSVANWPIYSNSKYKFSIKYPDTWYSLGTANPESDSIQFTSFKTDNSANDELNGSKIDIVFQSKNDKLLKDWIEANNIASNFKTGALSEIKIDGKTAYQQTMTAPIKSIATYLELQDKIMIISYTGSTDKFDTNKKIYEQVLDTIKSM